MTWIKTFYGTTVGKKVVMAASGVVLVLFVVGHMIGNLQFFSGPEKLNAYAAFLQGLGNALWVIRLGLLAIVGLHILAATQLTVRNVQARPVAYDHRDNVQASFASRTMVWSGPILALFVVYHILHYTTGNVHPEFVHGDVYANMITGFSVWYVSLFYIVAMLGLGFHMYHGFWSMFQTLGVNTPKRNRFWRGLALALALILTCGYISMPIAVLAGVGC